MKIRIFKFACFVVALSVGFCLIVQYLFNHQKTTHLYKLSNEHWIHRGLYNGVTVFENTIAAFDSAKKKGLDGIELDLFYIDSLHDFVVTHDVPNKFGLPVLLLSEVINRYDTSFYYWLDLKNLTKQNQKILAAKFENIIPAEVKKKVYIESGEASSLGYLAKRGFNTIYWIQYSRTNFAKKFIKKMMIKMDFIRYQFRGLSMGMTLADEDFFETFEPIPKYIFHIYTPELYNRIKNRANIAVYLMDYISED